MPNVSISISLKLSVKFKMLSKYYSTLENESFGLFGKSRMSSLSGTTALQIAIN